MIRLGVNIDHVATVRQARKAKEPDPVAAAVLATLGGADGITVHLREDRRHIQDRDVFVLRDTVTTRLNLELAAYDEIIAIALKVKPDEATLVPERRQELTTWTCRGTRRAWATRWSNCGAQASTCRCSSTRTRSRSRRLAR